MTKSIFDSFISAINAAGINQYLIRCEGGNRIIYNNDNSIIIPQADHIVAIEHTKNYATTNGAFNIIVVPYDNIDDIKTVDVPFKESITIMERLNSKTTGVDEFFKHAPSRMGIVPGTAGRDIVKDKEGKDVIAPGSYGYVTK